MKFKHVLILICLVFVPVVMMSWGAMAGKQSSDSLLAQLLEHEDKYTEKEIAAFVALPRCPTSKYIALDLCDGEQLYLLPDFSAAVVVTVRVLYDHNKGATKGK
ncbi:hypothetical protein KAR91_08080 [Candidatus Pacearchaeota archaeon]|nr:hypothetical protein [Candidatus Pacearchaeota archaeon]